MAAAGSLQIISLPLTPTFATHTRQTEPAINTYIATALSTFEYA